MHEIHVTVVSPEEAEYGVAELWSAGHQIGYTHLEDEVLMLRIEPRQDGSSVVLGVRALVEALGEANRLLAEF
jgi:hypothetical protein